MRRQRAACRRAAAANGGDIHGLLSCSEWTGVKLSTLLDEAGVDPGAMDSRRRCGRRRHEPQRPGGKAMDDAMIALYQNGEPIRPEGLPDAAAAAGLRRQHQCEMAAPAEGDRRADHHQGRDLALYRVDAGRQSAAIHAADGAQIGDLQAVLRHDHAGTGLLRNFRRRLVGLGASPRSMSRPMAARAGRKPR